MKAILEILAVTNDFRIETNLKFTKQEQGEAKISMDFKKMIYNLQFTYF